MKVAATFGAEASAALRAAAERDGLTPGSWVRRATCAALGVPAPERLRRPRAADRRAARNAARMARYYAGRAAAAGMTVEQYRAGRTARRTAQTALLAKGGTA